MSVRYRPGPMALVAVPAIALLTPDDAVALRAWELLDGLAGPTDLLQDLIRDGFAATSRRSYWLMQPGTECGSSSAATPGPRSTPGARPPGGPAPGSVPGPSAASSR